MEVEVEMENEGKKEKKMYGKYEEYEINNCVDTLMRAEEIKSDSEKMKYVKMAIDKKKKAIASISDLKDRYNEKMKSKDTEEY